MLLDNNRIIHMFQKQNVLHLAFHSFLLLRVQHTLYVFGTPPITVTVLIEIANIRRFEYKRLTHLDVIIEMILPYV